MKNLKFESWLRFARWSLFLGLMAYMMSASALPPTDAQILKIMVDANNEELATSKLVKASKNKSVRDLARHMIRAHASSNVAVRGLKLRLGLQMESSPISEGLEKDANSRLGEMSDLKGAKLDRAYIENLIAMHQAALKAIDEDLIPHAGDIQLKDLLLKTRVVVAKHLERAKIIQSRLVQ